MVCATVVDRSLLFDVDERHSVTNTLTLRAKHIDHTAVHHDAFEYVLQARYNKIISLLTISIDASWIVFL
jgi:hypothetical protein